MPFSRDWKTFTVTQRLGENPPDALWPEMSPAEVTTRKERVRDGWSALIYVLPNAISLLEEFDGVQELTFRGKACRVYPPFSVNEKSQAAALFDDVLIPDGNFEANERAPVARTAVRGLVYGSDGDEKNILCRGIRMDVEDGFRSDLFLEALMDHLTQFTNQWWLRSHHYPFHGPLRYEIAVDRDHRLAKEFGYRDAGIVHSTWTACQSVQQPLGFEKKLSKKMWTDCIMNIRYGNPAEIGFMYFYEAVGNYMASNDPKCVMDLSMCIEVLANKRLIADGKPAEPKLGKLIRKSRLVTNENRSDLQSLLIDRGHVAHGRPPHLIGKDDGPTIAVYIEAVRLLINKYVELMLPEEWVSMSQSTLKSTRTR